MLFSSIPNRGKAEELLGRDAFAKAVGLEVLQAEPGFAKVRMPVAAHLLNGHGNLHGGAMFTLADYAAAVASNMYGEPTMALNGSISFLHAVRGGYVTAVARTVKSGRRVTFQTVELFDSDETPVAIFQSGSIAVRRKAPSEEPAQRGNADESGDAGR